MREIKFRAWDKVNNRMLYFEPFKGVWDCEANTVIEACIVEEPRNGSAPGEDCVLLQYTGLKDKNGKEIYEGDIVRVSYKGEDGHPTAVGWVDYLKPSFIVRTKQDTRKPYFLCLYAYNQTPLFNWVESEVIGNIYENKELLDENNLQ